MAITKLKNGKYLVQLCFTANGKRYRPSKTFNTKAECNVWIAEQRIKNKNVQQHTMTVGEAVDKYIELCDTLSPSTIQGYLKYRANAFPKLMQMPISGLTDQIVQQAINEECKRQNGKYKKPHTIAPKTVCSEWGLVSTSIKYATGKTFNVRLPKKVKKLRRYPHPQEIAPLIKGTDIEIPCLMAMCLSLRMSEVRGARYSDLNNGYLFINQVKLYMGTDVIKEGAKTYESNRIVKVPKYLLDLIESSREGEYIVKFTAAQIYQKFTKLMKKNGYDLTFHSLRHIFASAGAMVGIEPLYLASMGGWNNTKVLEDTYEELFDSEKKRSENSLANYFDDLLVRCTK